MKTLVCLILFFPVFSSLLFAQWDLNYKYAGGFDIEFIDIATPSPDTTFVLANDNFWGSGYCFYTFDGGTTWDESQISLYDTLTDIDFPTNNVGYATSIEGALYKGVVGGSGITWQYIQVELLLTP